MNRVWKTKLEDEYGRAINPSSAFGRFVFDPQGSKAAKGILCTVLAAGVFFSLLTDFLGIDRITHAERKPNDPDRAWYWLRPHDWLFIVVVLYLIAGMTIACKKKSEQQKPRVYLFMWNSRIAFMPLVTTAFIFYFHVLKPNASNDLALEFTLGFTFFTCCVELIAGAWPSEWIDIVLPMVLGLAFLFYTALFSVFGVDLYVPLNWTQHTGVAFFNAFIFLVVLLTNATLITLLAKLRNRYFNVTPPVVMVGLTPQESLPML